MAGVTVKIKGPLFDSAPATQVRVALEELTASVAKQGAGVIKSKAGKFNVSGRGGTGAAAQAVTSRTEGTTAIVEGRSDRGKVWWPWLEGTSKRNRSTRFRGYHAFKLATNIMRKRMRTEAEKVMADVTERLGGA
jgi:hypothetical protein